MMEIKVPVRKIFVDRGMFPDPLKLHHKALLFSPYACQPVFLSYEGSTQQNVHSKPFRGENACLISMIGI